MLRAAVGDETLRRYALAGLLNVCCTPPVSTLHTLGMLQPLATLRPLALSRPLWDVAQRSTCLRPHAQRASSPRAGGRGHGQVCYCRER